jgi:hypothetical protein
MTDETLKPPTQAEILIRTLVAFPAVLIRHVVATVTAYFAEWETFTLFTGAGLIAYKTEEYVIVGGALLIVYAVIRILNEWVRGLADAQSLHGRVIRDNWAAQQNVAITQLPEALVRQVPPLTEEVEETE